jgi:hypothetical protein
MENNLSLIKKKKIGIRRKLHAQRKRKLQDLTNDNLTELRTLSKS